MLDHYVNLLKSGEVVAFPTETVYGLGADAWNPDAIQKVFDIKGRPADNPLIVHISSKDRVQSFAKAISEDAQKLMDHFWPGPLTLIFPKKTEVLDLLTGGLETVALRWPRHPLSQELIARVGPLVAPSANSSGHPSPTKPLHVKEDFGEDFPVIPAGETDIGLESTVLDVSGTPFKIYRPGAVTGQQIEKITGKKVISAASSFGDTETKSPGTKYTHYAPEASVHWLQESPRPGNTLYLLHDRAPHLTADNIIHYRGDYRKMAHELYDRFRQADQEGFSTIAIEPFTEDQKDALVPALTNRIQKALSK